MADIAAFVPPQNYAIQGANPSAAIAQGMQAGYGLQGEQNQMQAQQLALAQQAQLQQDLTDFASKPNPTASDYAAIMARHPQLADRFKASYDVMDSAQKQQQLQNITPVYAALRTGNPSVANDVLDKQIAAYDNAGNQQGVQGAQMMKKWIATSPDSAMHIIGFQLAATQPEKFGDIVSNLSTSARTDSLAPSEVAKSRADAAKATVDAGVAAAAAPALAAKPAIDNANTQQQTASSAVNARVAEFNAQINAANSQTEKDKLALERDKYVQEQAKLAQTQGQAAQDAQDSAQQALDTIGQIKKHPGLQDNLLQKLLLVPSSTKPGSMWGPLAAKIPGTDRQSLETYVDSLKSQLAYSNLQKMKQASPNGASGLGNMTEGEMKMLSGLAGSLDLNSNSFPTQLNNVEKAVQKAIAKGVSNPNLPTGGGAFVANSPKYGQITEGRINAVLKAHPELTRADVLRYLQQQGQ